MDRLLVATMTGHGHAAPGATRRPAGAGSAPVRAP
jgi:hypothetical protein